MVPSEMTAPLNVVGHSHRRLKLLVVDDEPINIQVLNEAFSVDHQVFMALNGEKAVAVCSREKPDLVLLDIEMPGMNGYEVCKQLKADAPTRDIPVIFVTAHANEDAEARGLEVGAVDYITKPISPRIVRACVERVLSQ